MADACGTMVRNTEDRRKNNPQITQISQIKKIRHRRICLWHETKK